MATPTAPALLAPGRAPCSYAQLLTHVDATGDSLRAAGVGAAGTVAVVLPNGPEMAATFLATASTARCAPLNPASTSSEAAAAFTDLDVAAVVVAAGVDSPARQAAVDLGVLRLELSPQPGGPAGTSTLTPSDGAGPPAGTQPRPDAGDVALLLRTSGTTARPKSVPLTHANLCTSAGNVARALELTGQDRCLNLMPLFHIHGLVACLSASLWAGGSVICTPGFDGDQVLGWIEDAGPSWYSAVPTLHQAMAGAASRRGAHVGSGLRFIRSSSAALPPQLLDRLEHTFDAPVVEAYGMTEAAHQIASNPLPPGTRKPGTVGLAAGPEVVVLGADGTPEPAGVAGEIAIRGPNVTSGYLDDAEANAAAFTPDGWLRTGDQGVLDEDGYLTITGRLKELINRGGEKVAPREVEEALLDHPAVAEAIAFAVTHPTLGEDVAAAVVLEHDDRGRTRAGDLRRFAGGRLASHKLPRRLVIVDAIPRGATGKLQRRGLAAVLGLEGGPTTTTRERRSPMQAALAGLWAEVLELERVEPDEDFFVLGGDSLSALELAAQVREVFGVELPDEAIVEEASTVAGMAGLLASARTRPGGSKRAGDAAPATIRRRRAPLRLPDPSFVPSLTERWHGDLRLLVDEGAAARGILLAFSDRSGGVSQPPFDSANLSLVRGDGPTSVLENRRRVAAAAGFNPYSLTVSIPVFGADVVEVGRRQRGTLGEGDVLVARTSGPVLGLFYADCAPLVLAGRGGVVLVHASRDGLLAGVVERAVAAVAPVWAAWIGPSVRGCCDVVEPEVIDDFVARGLPVVDGSHVDVPRAVLSVLGRAGVEQVAVCPDCTCCDERYFSRRRSSPCGRQGAFVGIRSDATPWEHLRSVASTGRAVTPRKVLRRLRPRR